MLQNTNIRQRLGCSYCSGLYFVISFIVSLSVLSFFQSPSSLGFLKQQILNFVSSAFLYFYFTLHFLSYSTYLYLYSDARNHVQLGIADEWHAPICKQKSHLVPESLYTHFSSLCIRAANPKSIPVVCTQVSAVFKAEVLIVYPKASVFLFYELLLVPFMFIKFLTLFLTAVSMKTYFPPLSFR